MRRPQRRAFNSGQNPDLDFPKAGGLNPVTYLRALEESLQVGLPTRVIPSLGRRAHRSAQAVARKFSLVLRSILKDMF